MFPAINIGPFVFPTAGLLYLLGVWVSLSVVERAAKALGIDVNRTYGVAVAGLIGGVVGARLVFVILYWSAFAENLLGIIWPLNSGYNLGGGLFFGAATMFFYGRYYQIDWLSTLDALIPGVVTGLIFVSLADFLGGPGFGTYSRAPWAIEQFSMKRHPVQIYEIIIGALALLAWWQVGKYRLFAGQLFLVTTAVYSGGRLFTEAFRQNAWFTADGYRIIQIVSLALMLVSLYFLGRMTDEAIAKQKESQELQSTSA